jgi:hypothetical protein
VDRPYEVRQLRVLLRHRNGLVRLGTQLQYRIHAVAADQGYDRVRQLLDRPGHGWLAEIEVPAVSRELVTDCLRVIKSDPEMKTHSHATTIAGQRRGSSRP